MTVLRPVLGDQLSHALASLRDGDKSRDVVLLVEVAEETTYVRHHPQKIALVLSAMRHFADALRDDGWTVDYVTLDDGANTGSFTGEIVRAVGRHGPKRIVATEPGEWRVGRDMDGWADAAGLTVEIREDDRFLCSRHRFAAWAKGRKQLRMEHFYREMRRETGILMDGDTPVDGRWNFDAENRRRLPSDVTPPPVREIEPDAITREVLDLVRARFPDHFGDLEPFRWAVTRVEALDLLERFVRDRLPRFGDFQDAMVVDEPHLFHALLSPYLNLGLLGPREVVDAALRAYEDGLAPLNATEGFVRQILGWREFVRGLYWQLMPDWAETNALDARRPLPGFYWTGETDLRCLAEAIGQTRRYGYAHHIQRLMVTGNFALLIGAAPKAVNRWYLEIYVDAFEWVELPNTHGMALFADGGTLASKPYAASGKYIDRMSDYCRSCRYNVRETTGEAACPFNALYWHFLDRNRDTLSGNHRLGMVYKTWDRMAPGRRAETLAAAERFLSTLDQREEPS